MPMHDLKPTPRFVEGGRIKLGNKKTKQGSNGQQVEYPSDAETFILTEAPRVAEAYGENPSELLFYFPFGSLEENVPSWHELWTNGSGCLCRGDGEHIEDRLDPRNNVTRVVRNGWVIKPYTDEDGMLYEVGQQVACPGKEHLYKRCKGCKPTTRLILMIRDPQQPDQLIARRLEYYLLTTKSYYNHLNLLGQASGIEFMARQMGQGLAGIPLKLSRRPQVLYYVAEDKNSGEEKRKQSTKWLLNIEVDMEWLQIANRSMYAAALAANTQQPLALPPGVDPETGEIIDEHYGLEDTFGKAPDHDPVIVARPRAAAPAKPENGKKHDWTWFYGDAISALGYTVRAAKEALGEDFQKHMTPDQAIEALRALMPEQQTPIPPIQQEPML